MVALTKEDLQAIANLMDTKLEKALQPMNERLDSMQDDIKAVKITLENEVTRDISLIRESQLDQARHVDEIKMQLDSIENKLDNSVIVKAVTSA